MINIIELTREEKSVMKKTMAQHLPEFRKLLGVTQEVFGKSCGILRDRLSIIERGAAEMTWVQFLSILFVLLFNNKTKAVIMQRNLFPIKLYQSLQFFQDDAISEIYIRINPIDGMNKSENDVIPVEPVRKATLKDGDIEGKNIQFTELKEYIPAEIKNMDTRIGHYSSFFVTRLMEIGGYDCLTQKICDNIREAFLYTNVGYAFLPENLRKDRILDDSNTELLKLHVARGFDAIYQTKMTNEDKDIDCIIQLAMDVAVSHHELWNGEGYPYGLKGEQIPLLGRIYAIFDRYDSIVMGRGKEEEPMSHDYAVTKIVQQSGKLFDPKLIRIFYLNRDKFLLI